MKSNIVLIGMPGCGKSTIGVVLAKILGKKFIDSDLVIQEKSGKLLQEILDNDGIEVFFYEEEKALLSIKSENAVIATGGSAIFSEKGMNFLKETSIVVYLSLKINEIKIRLTNLKTRGVANADSKSIEEIFVEREPLYKKYCDIEVNCENKEIYENVNAIIAKTKNI